MRGSASSRANPYRGARILVLGATGSIGSEIVRQVLVHRPAVVRVYSRDESKHLEMQEALGEVARPPKGLVRFLVGDVRDRYRLKRAMEGIEVAFHAAALKHVPSCEYNPFEAVQTNVVGTQNVIEAALDAGVERLIGISTDKSVNPANTMGATKLLSERVITAAARWARGLRLGCVRFGNVLGSRGSVVPLVLEQLRRGAPVTLTDPRMARFALSISEAVKLVIESGRAVRIGELFILKMPVLRIKELLEVLIEHWAPEFGREPSKVRIRTIGLREGEKLQEELLTREELPRTEERKKLFVVHPPFRIPKRLGKAAPIDPATYCSGQAPRMSREQIARMLKRAGLLPGSRGRR